MELKPGEETSEFMLTKVVMAFGAILDIGGVLLEALRGSELQATWLPAAMMVCGSLLILAKALGYTRSRTVQKVAMMGPQAMEVAKGRIPLVQQMKELMAEVRQTEAELGEPKTDPLLKSPPA